MDNNIISSKTSSALREWWYGYRSEVWFFITLMAIVVLSTYLSRFIPETVFNNIIIPILITATVSTAFIGAWVMYRRNEEIKARKLFGLSLLVWGLIDLVYLVGWVVAPHQVMDMGAAELTNYELLLGNFLGWVMLLYPTEALRPGWLTWKTSAWQLLPLCALVAIDYIVPLDLSPIIALYPYVLLALLFTHMRAYKIWCEENYSTLDDIDVRWLIRYCCMLFFVGINYIYICYSHNPTRGFTQLWFVIFMMAYSIEQVLFRRDPWKKVEVESKPVCQSEGDNSPKRSVLMRWMQETKPYLNPDFQLMDLNQILPMNRTYLSSFIRDEFGCTFYQWVNSLRVKEAKRLMSENPDMKIQDIAEHCGFSSRRVFTQIFTRETGTTPIQWVTAQNNPQ